MKDTESYVNKADVKRKIRAWLKYRQSSKQVADELLGLIEKLPVTVKSQLETTLESEWVSVKDKLPKQYTDVIVFIKSDTIAVDYVDENGDFYYYGEYVTHWAQLPEPPERKDADGDN